jgi:hypothetical protein
MLEKFDSIMDSTFTHRVRTDQKGNVTKIDIARAWDRLKILEMNFRYLGKIEIGMTTHSFILVFINKFNRGFQGLLNNNETLQKHPE